MAVYKVPQDVEADDKLIGPFSFRQFVYLVIVVLCIFLAWALWQIFIPLAMIPLPAIVFFGALALPLRKDQPMEIYMAAMVSFYLKPHRRLWDPDGIDSLIEITVPKTVEVQRTKDLSQSEAERRFSYLADVVDSQGWSIRGPDAQASNSAMQSDVYFEAQQVEDVLDVSNSTAQAFDYKLNQSDAQRHEQMVGIMANSLGEVPLTVPAIPEPELEQKIEPAAIIEKPLEYNPYPQINQTVIQPTNKLDQVVSTAANTSEKVVPAGIINLASNTDLSIAAIAREANRIQEKQDQDEVVIKLR